MSCVLHELKTPHQPNNSKHTKLYNNISVAEKHAINNLRKNDQIIVKPADKGGVLVIWPREAYIAEANKQLNDKRNYKLVKMDHFLNSSLN